MKCKFCVISCFLSHHSVSLCLSLLCVQGDVLKLKGHDTSAASIKIHNKVSAALNVSHRTVIKVLI